MSDLIGKEIRGYELREKVGQGGFAAVYLAHQPAIKRDVAIKVILPEHVDVTFSQRFEREARLVAQLEHFNITPVYDYWYNDEDGAFLVMRYLEGGSLSDVLKHERLSLKRTVEMMKQICEALDFAHKKHIVHRDIKPGNILLDDKQNAYVTDFGIAKSLNMDEIQLTKTGDVLGTPAYFAPEQAFGEGLSPQVDIYALGIVVFEMLTGKYPFPGQPFMHLASSLPSVRDYVPELPRELDDIIEKATAKEVANRYQTATELADALQSLWEDYDKGLITGIAVTTEMPAIPDDYVYIVHIEEDEDTAATVQNMLESMGISAHAGSLTETTLERQQVMISACTEGVVILSKAATNSTEWRNQWRTILSQNKRLYTLIVDDVPKDVHPFRLQLTPEFNLQNNAIQALTQLVQAIFDDRDGGHTFGSSITLSQTVHLVAQSAYLLDDVADIPNRAENLIGRDELMEQVESNLKRHKRVLLQGLGGLGKTTLAAEITARYLENEDNAHVLWLKVGNDTADTILQALLVPIHDDPASVQGDKEIAKALREAFDEKQIGFIVFDDVWMDGAEFKKVIDALPKHMQVLMTSRERFPVGKIMDVNVLPLDMAVELINSYAYTDFTTETESIETLCETLGYHTLALEIAAKTMQVDDLTPEKLLKAIEDAPHTMSMPYGFAEEGRENVKNLLDASVAILDDAASEVFFTYGVMADPTVTPELIALCLEQPLETIEMALQTLEKRGLVKPQKLQKNDLTMYGVHGLAHSYARTNRQLEKYRVVEAVEQYVAKNTDNLNALDAERNNILSTAQTAFTIGKANEFISIVYKMAVDSTYLQARGHDRLFIQQLENAITIARNTDDKERLHYLLSKRANIYYDRGNNAAAVEAYLEATELAEDLDNKKRIVESLAAMSRPFIVDKMFDRAETLLNRATKIADEMDDDNLRMQVLEKQSTLEVYQENYEAAKKIAEKQVEIALRQDSTEEEFYAYYNLGGVNLYLEQFESALKPLASALAAADQLNNRIYEAMVYMMRGYIYTQMKELEKAKKDYRYARQIYKDSGMLARVEEVEGYMREGGYEINE